jgi:hypothetical protein
MTGRDAAQIRIDDLLRFPGAGGAILRAQGMYADPWPAILPSDPEVVAAHLLTVVAETDLGEEWVPVVRRLAHVARPPGAVTATLIAMTFGGRSPAQRDSAAELLSDLIAHERLPATELAVAIGRLARTNTLKLGRMVAALCEVVRAGPVPGLWPVFVAALPDLLDTRRPVWPT